MPVILLTQTLATWSDWSEISVALPPLALISSGETAGTIVVFCIIAKQLPSRNANQRSWAETRLPSTRLHYVRQFAYREHQFPVSECSIEASSCQSMYQVVGCFASTTLNL
jgi:hypothetical protein